MHPANWFNLLPNEIAIGIFRSYFNYDEKLNMLKDDYFWCYLSTPYAWKEKLKVSLKTLKGASENLLHEIESGYYKHKEKKTVSIFKVLKNNKRGIVTVEQFIHKTQRSSINSNQPKVKKDCISTDRVKSVFNHIKSNYRVLQHDIYTDRWGLNTVDIELTFLESMKCYALLEAPGYLNVYIYKKPQCFYYIVGDLEFCKMNPISNLPPELIHFVSKIAHSNCNKIMKTKNYYACKMIPWRKYYRCRVKTTFNYMFSKKMIKITTKIK